MPQELSSELHRQPRKYICYLPHPNKQMELEKRVRDKEKESLR